MEKSDFRRRSGQALKDDSLRQALSHFTGTFVQLREAAQSEVAQWQNARQSAQRVKEHTINNLDRYLCLLESRLNELGARVLWAETAEEARAAIVGIARRHDCRIAVKSKSMTTEEIELNPRLEREGIRTVETDLGEFVAQLANERPSHILAPIVHKSRQEVGRLLAEKLDVEYTEQVEVMTRTAREKLRHEFLSADLGITGANFAVAETGTLVIVENEGNARLVTTLPRVHVAILGIEKILPRFSDLALFLPLLTRAATGQRMSSYVSLLNGPRKEERDGPEVMYVVLLDNGRTRMLSDPVLRPALHCIRCSACLNVCPIYQRVGGHAYGTVYPGPIGSVVSPMLAGSSANSNFLPFASTLCGACADVCPVKIPLPEQLLHLRRQGLKFHSSVPVEISTGVRLWSFLIRHRRLQKIALALIRSAQRAPGYGLLAARLPILSSWAQSRALPRLRRPSGG